MKYCGRSITWAPTSGPDSLRFAKWETEGQVEVGVILSYQRGHGAHYYGKTYADGRCGSLIIRKADGSWLKLALDKDALADAVDWAVIAAWAAFGQRDPLVIAVRYEGVKDGVKRFSARCGLLGEEVE